MRAIDHLLQRLRGERGFVMPTTAVVLGLAVLTAGVAASQTITAQDGSVHEKYAKRALQAADAGVEVALYRMNRLGVSRTAETNKCVGVNAASGEAFKTAGPAGGPYVWDGASAWPGGSTGWCDAVSGSTDDGATYSYRVSAEAADPTAAGELRRMVVSTGTYQGISRRVAVAAQARRAQPLFANDFAVFSDRDFRMEADATVDGSVGSNGQINMAADSYVCGNATPGAGKTVTFTANATVACDGSTAAATERFDLPPVVADLSVNDNSRICAAGGDACTDPGAISWNPSTRRLSLGANSTLTLGGSVYAFCYLALNANSQIIIPPKPPGSVVKVYIDSPENCLTSNPRGNLSMGATSKIVNQNASPVTFQVYMLGSPTVETTANFNADAAATEVRFAFYAPYTTVRLEADVTFRGAFAALQVTMNANSRVIYDGAVQEIQADTVYPRLSSKRWVECARAPTTAGQHHSGC